MGNKRTFRAMLGSLAALLACIALLAGTAFAWFTDSVSNEGNRISAGKLEVSAFAHDAALVCSFDEEDPEIWNNEYVHGYVDPLLGEDYYAGFKEENKQILKEDSSPIIKDELFEPGKRGIKLVRVVNSGSLAVKVRVSFDVKDSSLAEALWFSVGGLVKQPMTELSGYVYEKELRPMTETPDEVQILFLYGMNTNADNTYQNLTFAADLHILATQCASETDGFGNSDYDADAVYPGFASTETELKALFASAKDGDKITVDRDLTVSRGENRPGGTPDTYITAENVVLDLNGKTLTVSCAEWFAMAANGITVKNGTIEISDESKSYPLTVSAYAKNVVIEDVTVIGGIAVTGNGTEVTLRNVTSVGTNYRYGLYLAGGATATVENCTFTPGPTSSAYMYLATPNDKVILNSAVFTDESVALSHSTSKGTVVDNRN